MPPYVIWKIRATTKKRIAIIPLIVMLPSHTAPYWYIRVKRIFGHAFTPITPIRKRSELTIEKRSISQEKRDNNGKSRRISVIIPYVHPRIIEAIIVKKARKAIQKVKIYLGII